MKPYTTSPSYPSVLGVHNIYPQHYGKVIETFSGKDGRQYYLRSNAFEHIKRRHENSKAAFIELHKTLEMLKPQLIATFCKTGRLPSINEYIPSYFLKGGVDIIDKIRMCISKGRVTDGGGGRVRFTHFFNYFIGIHPMTEDYTNGLLVVVDVKTSNVITLYLVKRRYL